MKRLVLLLLLPVCALSQTPYFRDLSVGEAYPGTRVEVMHQDRSGMLWFGSSKGLFRFDGLEFVLLGKSDSSSQRVRAILQDKKMCHWVGYDDGSIYQLKGEKLQRWMPDEGTPKTAITDMEEDGQGQLWFATYGEGVYCYDGVHLYNFDMDDGLLGNEIYAMCQAPDGRIWLGTDGGISICRFQKGKKMVENLTRADGLPDEIVHELLPDGQGGIWVGTYDNGISRYNLQKRRFEFPLKGWQQGIVSHLAFFEGKELWIGTNGNGLWRYSIQDSTLLRVAGFEKSKLYGLLKDTEGNIWTLSNTRGISYANCQFELIAAPAFKSIQAVLFDRQNRLWVGTPDGLFEHRPDKDGNPHFRPWLQNLRLNVVSLYEDKFENIWLGTFDKGAFCFNPTSGKLRQFTEKQGITNNSVLSIDGASSHVWLATLGGVTEIENESDPLFNEMPIIRRFDREDGLATNFIYKVFVDSQKRTWFGTDGQGISLLENGRLRNFKTYQTTDPASGAQVEHELKAVYSLTEDLRGHIWLSTASEGIFEFDGHTFKHLAVKEGIRDLAITSLATDANGHVIIVHPSGVDLLMPASHHLIYYDEEIGLNDIEPNLNATCTDRFGNVWMGIRNGILKHTPLKAPLDIHPKTYLHKVTAAFQAIDFQQVDEISYRQNNLVFEFFGLWYTDPAAVRYRYRLRGYDHDWVATKDRHATYSSLPPGKYVFEVMSTENEAWSDESVVAYAFEISPPIWQRWWFVLSGAALISCLFFWYQKTRDRRLQRVNLLEKEKAESELATLKAQISPHFLFNSFNTLIGVIEEDPKTAVEYVERMSDFYRSMMQLRDKEVITLEEDVELVQNFDYLLQKRYGKNFRLDIQLSGQESGYIVPLTLQILLENAVKHNVISKLRPLVVEVKIEEPGYLTVSNNLQPKLHTEASTGFGLASLRRRYEMLTGKKVKIEASKDQFKVSVPISP